MEVLRGMELTDTNRPRACLLQRCYASTVQFPRYGRELDDTVIDPTHLKRCFGGHGERETPGSIPNPEVKPLSADGTAGGSLWETRTPPDLPNPLGEHLGALQGGFSRARTGPLTR